MSGHLISRFDMSIRILKNCCEFHKLDIKWTQKSHETSHKT